jgi:IclR family transcriptional regulator, KDG regulon repressor
MKSKPIYLSKSLHKALTILDLFDERVENLRTVDIAKKLDINPSSLYPILTTLERHGYLNRDKDNKKYFLGFEYLKKSQLILKSLDIRECSQPYLKELLLRCKQNVHLGILDKNINKVIYVDRKEASPNLAIHSFVGKQSPLYCTALGKVFLSSMDSIKLNDYIKKETFIKLTDHTITEPSKLIKEINKVKENGFAIDKEEYQLGGICIAAPIKSYQNEIVASISISIHKSNFSSDKSSFYINEVKNAARNISRSLGFNE